MRTRSLVELSLCALLLSSVTLVTPAHAATPKPTATAKPSPTITLTIAADHPEGYKRSYFKIWVDADGNGCNARKEVLIAQAVIKPTIGKGCYLTGGKWISPYDGKVLTSMTQSDIDHLVPLDEAWRSGAWSWTALQRETYANDLKTPNLLMAVDSSINREKGDKDPANWMPPLWKCNYISAWITVKSKYHLTVDTAEAAALTSYIKSCFITNVKIV